MQFTYPGYLCLHGIPEIPPLGYLLINYARIDNYLCTTNKFVRYITYTLTVDLAVVTLKISQGTESSTLFLAN